MKDEGLQEIDEYGDPGTRSAHGKIPRWLFWSYIIISIFGIIWGILFWNGNQWGWLDRGAWGGLQKAANTTFPIHNANLPKTDE